MPETMTVTTFSAQKSKSQKNLCTQIGSRYPFTAHVPWIWRRPVQMALDVYELLLPMSYILAVRLHDIARLQL